MRWRLCINQDRQKISQQPHWALVLKIVQQRCMSMRSMWLLNLATVTETRRLELFESHQEIDTLEPEPGIAMLDGNQGCTTCSTIPRPKEDRIQGLYLPGRSGRLEGPSGLDIHGGYKWNVPEALSEAFETAIGHRTLRADQRPGQISVRLHYILQIPANTNGAVGTGLNMKPHTAGPTTRSAGAPELVRSIQVCRTGWSFDSSCNDNVGYNIYDLLCSNSSSWSNL